MPLYEYECRLCNSRFERRQSVNDDPISQCPDCGGAVRRVLFPVGVIFKGSGFYVTDSRRPQPIGESNGDKSKSDGAGANGAAKPAAETGGAKPSTESAPPAGGGGASDGKTTVGATS